MVFSGIIRSPRGGDLSGSYAQIGPKYIVVLIPYEIVFGMVRGDWSCLLPNRFHCDFDVFVAKGGEENQVLVFIDRAEIEGARYFGLPVLMPSAPDPLRESYERLTKEWLEAYKGDTEKLLKLGRPLPHKEEDNSEN